MIESLPTMVHPSETPTIANTLNEPQKDAEKNEEVEIVFETDSSEVASEDEPLFENYLDDTTIHLEDPHTPTVTLRDRLKPDQNDVNDEITIRTSNTHGGLIPHEYHNVKPQGRLRAQQRARNLPPPTRIPSETTLFCFLASVPDETIDDTPLNFRDAWWHPNLEKRGKWREAIRKEFHQMIKNMVWLRKGLTVLPPGRKGIGTKWVFKEKKDGVFRARLVAKGYNQIAGIDFQLNFAPVTNEVALRIMLILWITKEYFAEIADVETAFLHGELEEELYLKIPNGLCEFLEEIGEKFDGDYLKLTKSIYGLVQAARSWWKKFTKVLKENLKFESFPGDSCLLRRNDENGSVFLILYVDDCFVLGNRVAVKAALEEIEKHFSIKRNENVHDFIGCSIERTGNKIFLSQPDLITKLLAKFEHELRDLQEYLTPAPQGARVILCEENESILNSEMQSRYQSGVGSLLYLLKHSRPELSNCVRELSKGMTKANEAHYKLLLRAIKYLQMTKGRKLILHPKTTEEMWSLKAYSDSDFAGDKNDRRSVSGFVIYLCGCPVAWKSRSQKSVTLSSTEAEYVAISEVATEILYIKSLLDFVNVKVDMPIEVFVDNIGAIFLSKNASTGNRTKHVDTRYHFVRDYIENGVLKVTFVRLEMNDADIFTKNLGNDSFNVHTNKLYMSENEKDENPN